MILRVIIGVLLVGRSCSLSVRQEVCKNGYGLDCLKYDLLSMVGQFESNLRLGPGLYISHDPAVILSLDKKANESMNGKIEDNEIHEKTTKSEDKSSHDSSFVNSTIISNLLRRNIRRYLQSITLTVRLVDPVTVNMASSLSSKLFDSNVTATYRGRHKKGHHHVLLACVGMIAAVGLSTLAALSGKALMTSLLALLLAGASALKNNSHGHDCSAKTVGLIDTITHSRHSPIAVDRMDKPPYYMYNNNITYK